MLRREIEKMTLTYLGKSYQCSAPASVYSVLSAAGEQVDLLKDTAAFTVEIEADKAALAVRYVYARFCGFKAEADLFLNGNPLGGTEGRLAAYDCSISQGLKEGINTLEIRFSAGTPSYSAGVFRPVRMQCFNNAIISKVSLSQKHDGGAVTLGINLDLLGNTENVRAVATLVSSAGQIYYGGLTRGKGSITLRDPLFWWPKGLGVQNLYSLTVNLYGENNIEDTTEMRIGLRTAKSTDSNATILVNGLEVLPMGATYYADLHPNFASEEKKITALVTSAAMANYNCILIPSDAPVPSEKFYELCNVHGILVIEEMSDPSASDIYALERRVHHPCLSLIDLAEKSQNKIEDIKAVAPDLAVAVWDKFPEYTSCPSLPSDRTVATVVPEGERNLFSYSIEKISPDGSIKEMLMSVADRYPYPGNLSDFAYASALASAAKVKESIWNARLSENKQRAIFDRLSDERAIASPSAIDCAVRWKPLQYHSMKNFAPLAIHAAVDGCKVTFTVSNARKNDLFGSLEYRIVDASNVTIFKGSDPCEVSAFSTETVLTKDFSEYLEGHLRDYYLEYSIKEGVTYPCSDTLLFVPEKHFRFRKPEIKTEIVGADRRFNITLSANCFVKDLELDFDGVDAIFSENYIDLTSPAPVKISVTLTGALETAYHLGRILKLRSVYDIK